MKYALIFAALFSLHSSLATVVVDDVTQINPIKMNKVIEPTTIEQIQKAIKESKGPISIGGGRFSMGGQTAIDNGIQLDMRKFNKVVKLDLAQKQITVQAGMRWRDIQETIDKHNLSIKIMQTYSNFTVGGSLSVNAHGRYVGEGPIIRSVISLKVVLADGKVMEVSPQKDSELFYGVMGGYGGLGVIVEATLQLVDNIKIESQINKLDVSEYRKFFNKEIRNNPDYIFHNGDLYPPEFKNIKALSWKKSSKPLTETKRLIDRDKLYVLEPLLVGSIAVVPGGKKLRQEVLEPALRGEQKVVWRNHEASYDVAELEPLHRKFSTYVLQEYFIPVDKFEVFIPKMRKVFKDHDVNVVNVSIRHALPDTGSLLTWAPQEVFSFVVYVRQGITDKDKVHAGNWTRKMIDEVLSVQGTYYLPYQIHATSEQFEKAYPNYKKFFALKKSVDPQYRFKNKLWEKYYP